MKRICTLAILTFSMQGYALDSGLYLGGNIGRTNMAIDQNFQNERDDISAAALGLTAGYLFNNHVLVQANATGSENFTVLGAVDRYNLQHADIHVGYELQWKKLRFVPSLGIAKWELNAKEGQFLNPGAEATTKHSGDDPVLGLSIGFAFNRHFQMSATRKVINTHFGSYDQMQLDFLFHITQF